MIKKFLLLLVVLAGLALLSFQWWLSQHRPGHWYPFVGGFWGDTYVATPFGFTSNVRQDNPFWQTLPAFNRALARSTYAMTRGQPDVDIAWLMTQAEWPDPVDLDAGLDPNVEESALSRTLTSSGLVYNRISRENLRNARAVENQLQVGAMRYRALLIDNLAAPTPELLQAVERLARAGVPVIWLGKQPERAYGWRDHEARDQAVARLRASLQQQVKTIQQAEELMPTLAALGIQPFWADTLTAHAGLHSQRRRAGSMELALLFNDSPQPLTITLADRVLSRDARVLDPESGATQMLSAEFAALTIPPRRFRLLQVGDSAAWDAAQWQNPAREYRPYIRWWWPGNAVAVEELKRELQAMEQAGFGGVEIQTLTFGMEKSYLERHSAAIYGVGTAAWLHKVREVIAEGHRLGLRVDLTLGSGWPTGAPFMTDYPEQQLLKAEKKLQAGEAVIVLPTAQEPAYAPVTRKLVYDSIGAFDTDTQLAAVVVARADAEGKLVEWLDVSDRVQAKALHWQVPAGEWKLFAFYQNDTHHNVLAAAFPGAELQRPHQVSVVDHLDERGMAEYLEKLGQPWLDTLQPQKPDAFFVDSFELMGDLPWSSRFRAAFQAQHGYDLTPYLPLVFRKNGESKYYNMIVAAAPAYEAADARGARIREDYEATREALFRDSYVVPLQQWLSRRGIAFRLQAHGGFGDYLDNYQLADIPESEALFAGGNFEFLTLAASAGHIAAKPIISSESFVAAAMDPQRLTEDDYYYLAGNAYAAGINRLMFHGYAYRLALE